MAKIPEYWTAEDQEAAQAALYFHYTGQNPPTEQWQDNTQPRWWVYDVHPEIPHTYTVIDTHNPFDNDVQGHFQISTDEIQKLPNIGFHFKNPDRYDL